MSSSLPPAARTLVPILRAAVLLAVLLAAFSALCEPAAGDAPGEPARGRGREDAPAARAVTDLAGPRPAGARLPADLERVTGHRVALVAGRPLSERGGCSSPVPLPAVFDDACRAHDLGYDLLRYADRRGARLGGWARRAIDAQLARDLSAACSRVGGGGGCRLVAGLADVVVGANSWRQGFGVPAVETPARVVATTLAALVTAGAFPGSS